MSTIWTPSGERPIRREEPEASGAPQSPSSPRQAEARSEQSEQEVQAHLEELTRELAQTPAAMVVSNHAMGLFELAALHLSQRPPNLAEAQLAIDAMSALVENLAGRLGENETTLKDALAQIRLAFVQIRAAGVDLSQPPSTAG